MASNSTISVTFKLDGDSKSFKQLTKEADGLKKALNSTASEAAQLPKKFDYKALAKNLAGVTAAASAVGAAIGKLAGDAVNLTQTWGDKWAVEMSGARSAYQHLVRDLASGDGWGQLIERMTAASEAGRKLAATLDELFERNISLSYTEAEINKKITEQQLIMRDASKTAEERKAAAREIIRLEDELLGTKKNIASQEAAAYRDSFKAQTHLNDAQIDFLLKEYNQNRDIINQARAYNEERSKLQAQKNTADANVMFGGFGGAINAGISGASSELANLEANTSAAIKSIAELVKLYDRSNDELVKSMTDAEVAVINLDAEANRMKLRPTATLGTLNNKTGSAGTGKNLSLDFDSDVLKNLEAETLAAESSINRATNALMIFYGVDPSGLDPTIRQIERIGDSANGVIPEIQGMLDTLQDGINNDLSKSLGAGGGIASGLDATTSAISAMADVMGGLNGIVGESAGSWLSWGANVVKSIASAIPAIVSLISLQGAKATADTVSATTGAAASVSGVPIVGPALAITAVATVLGAILSAVGSIPKFADGGIIFGPTLGLIGEYSGASNNPEIVAPLDKLRSMFFDDGVGGNTPRVVELKARGRDLVGVLSLEADIRRRS